MSEPTPNPQSIQERAIRWALGDDTGMSSKTLCAFMLGFNETNGARGYGRSYPPSDAADRGRCIRLLKRIPEWIPRLPELAEANVGGLQDGTDNPAERSWAHQIELIIQEGNFNADINVGVTNPHNVESEEPKIIRDKYGRHFTYYHGTNSPLEDILANGIRPGSDGYIYLSVRRDFAENYGKTVFEVRLPYELEPNPFSPSINGEVRSTTSISIEYVKILISAANLLAWRDTHAQKSVDEALLATGYYLRCDYCDKVVNAGECRHIYDQTNKLNGHICNGCATATLTKQDTKQ